MDLPEDFPFPFPPYPIQDQFMKNLFLCLENGNLGIFESPTGTGKTLSIICGALKWLLDHETQQRDDLVEKIREIDAELASIKEENANDWFSLQTKQMELNLQRQTLKSKLDAIEKQDEKRLKFKERVKNHEESETQKKRHFVRKQNVNDENKASSDNTDAKVSEDDQFDVDLILKDMDFESEKSDEEEVEEESSKYSKIFFCSRTHTQLSQFIGELKKSPYSEKVSLVSLASR